MSSIREICAPDCAPDWIGDRPRDVRDAGGLVHNELGLSGGTVLEQERMTLSIEEAAALLGISRALAYELVRRGDLPRLRLGRRVVIPKKALEEFVVAATATSP